MKKVICAILTCSVILTAASAMAKANGKAYTVKADSSVITLNEGEAYEKNSHVMIPLRKVAEKLGFKVEWNGERQGVMLDNGEVNSTVYIGEDSYYMASSVAIGMSAPTSLGAAPELKGDLTYVPADIFKVLYCNDGAVKIDGETIVINSKDENSVQIPNPFTEHETVENAKRALSFDPVIPTAVPDGYRLDYISTMSDNFIQLVYKNGENEFMYRMAKGTDDISGDYNVYKNIKTVDTGNLKVTVRGNDKMNGAVWTDGTYSYAVYSSEGISESDALKLVSSIK